MRHLNAQRAQLASAMTAIPDSANGLLVTAPESVRERYRGLRGGDRMNGLAECRPAGGLVERSAPAALKSTAKAWKALKRQSGPLEERMRAILQEHARPSPDMYCAGIVIAAALAIVAGDDPERIRSEAAFAKLCGAYPLPASSGRTNRHRLNKGGNRQGDMALRRIAIVRLRTTSPPGTTPPGRPVRVRAGSRTSAASNGSSPVRRAGCSSPYATVGSGVGCRPNAAPDCANRAWATVSPTAGRRGAMRAVQPHQKDRTRQTGPARTRATGHPMDSLHHQSKTTHPNA